MKLITEKDEPSRPLGIFVGGLKTIVAAALLWAGLNSFLIGLAYYTEKGFWIPVLTGATLSMIGFWVLVSGSSGLCRGLWPEKYESRQDLL